MAFLQGLPGQGVQMVSVGGPVTPNSNAGGAAMPDLSGNTIVIDGTPVRVVVLALAAAAGLTALKLGGFRFNVGVST